MSRESLILYFDVTGSLKAQGSQPKDSAAHQCGDVKFGNLQAMMDMCNDVRVQLLGRRSLNSENWQVIDQSPTIYIVVRACSD